MQKRLRQLAALTLLALAPFATLALASEENVAEVLQRQTQELLDAVSSGSASVWERHLDAKAAYTAEDGTVLTKAQMVEQIRPLPKGVSGIIKVTDSSGAAEATRWRDFTTRDFVTGGNLSRATRTELLRKLSTLG